MSPRPLIIDNICAFISARGKSALRSVLLRPNIRLCLQHTFTIRHIPSAVKCASEVRRLWALGRSHEPVMCPGFWTVEIPKSKRDLAQCDNASELLNEIDGRVLKSQVWFHVALTSAGAPAISSRQTRGTRVSSTFTVTSAREESVATTRGKSSAAPPLRHFISVRTSLIFLPNL